MTYIDLIQQLATIQDLPYTLLLGVFTFFQTIRLLG